jgi:hypothetical protein
MRPLIQTVFWALIAAAVAVLAYTAPMLPDLVASGFDGAGLPRAGKTSKEIYLVRQVFLMIGLPLLIAYALPALLPKLPNWQINLPYKDYYLAPERRKQTFERISLWTMYLACAMCALMIAIYLASLGAQLHPGTRMNMGVFIGAMVVFAKCTVVFAFGLHRCCGKPSGAAAKAAQRK